MSRLILFSGGVESTAMLTLADKDDIVMTIRDTSPTDYFTYHPDQVEKIASFFKIKIHYTDLNIPLKQEKSFVHQLWTFVPLAMIWTKRFPRITKMWYGLNCEETVAPAALNDFSSASIVWTTATNGIPLEFPLQQLTKKQQWDMIPKEVQPLISTCLYNNYCGQCRKCKKLSLLKS